MSTTTPSQYARLSSGTRMLWGEVDDETAALQLLEDADAIGSTGKKGSAVEITRLIDTDKQYMSDMDEGPDKEYVFLDNPGNTALSGFLAKAEAKDTVKIRIEFPNGRWADLIVALFGWEMKELEKGQPMKISVSGKQNGITRGYTAP